jgi:hypothetical protein
LKNSEFIYETYNENLRDTHLGLGFDDSQKIFDTKISKIYIKM